MLDEDFLRAFVGQEIELRPAAGRDAVRDGVKPRRGSGRLTVAAVVVGVTNRSQLCIETNDMRVLELGDRAVSAECISSLSLLRVQGGLEVLAEGPLPPASCLLSPFDHPGAVERRQWARVRCAVPVRIHPRDLPDKDGDENAVRTVSIDLSGGGIKVGAGPEVTVGSTVSLDVELPTGLVRIKGEVLERGRDGATRLRFLAMPEAMRTRIIRHIFDVQMAHRKTAR
ncbi:MAG TPA: PilZ domain-containing protein [Acidimicrobiales bacterium]|nr:PilZ domain-containing protein [Acidimicrobiales bacterium]